jgi:hypothetical protein
VLVAMMLMLIIMFAVLGAWSRLGSTYTFTNDDMTSQAQSRTAMGEIVESIRTSQLNTAAPAEALKSVIPVAKPNEVWLWIDPGGSGTLKLVSFKVDTSAGILYRLQAAAGAVDFTSANVQKLITADVMNSRYDPATGTTRQALFTYYDANGVLLDAGGSSGVADPTKISEVHIDLLVDVATGRAPITNELSSVVQPRNLRQY